MNFSRLIKNVSITFNLRSPYFVSFQFRNRSSGYLESLKNLIVESSSLHNLMHRMDLFDDDELVRQIPEIETESLKKVQENQMLSSTEDIESKRGIVCTTKTSQVTKDGKNALQKSEVANNVDLVLNGDNDSSLKQLQSTNSRKEVDNSRRCKRSHQHLLIKASSEKEIAGFDTIAINEDANDIKSEAGSIITNRNNPVSHSLNEASMFKRMSSEKRLESALHQRDVVETVIKSTDSCVENDISTESHLSAIQIVLNNTGSVQASQGAIKRDNNELIQENEIKAMTKTLPPLHLPTPPKTNCSRPLAQHLPRKVVTEASEGIPPVQQPEGFITEGEKVKDENLSQINNEEMKFGVRFLMRRRNKNRNVEKTPINTSIGNTVQQLNDCTTSDSKLGNKVLIRGIRSSIMNKSATKLKKSVKFNNVVDGQYFDEDCSSLDGAEDFVEALKPPKEKWVPPKVSILDNPNAEKKEHDVSQLVKFGGPRLPKFPPAIKTPNADVTRITAADIFGPPKTSQTENKNVPELKAVDIFGPPPKIGKTFTGETDVFGRAKQTTPFKKVDKNESKITATDIFCSSRDGGSDVGEEGDEMLNAENLDDAIDFLLNM